MGKSKEQKKKEREDLIRKATEAGVDVGPTFKVRVEPPATQADIMIIRHYLANLLESFAAGSKVMLGYRGEQEADNNPANIERVASELVNRYATIRGVLRDANKVAYDGALKNDVRIALAAAENRGRLLEHYNTCSGGYACQRCKELGSYTTLREPGASGFLTRLSGIGKTSKQTKAGTDDDYTAK
jgi:hypothetical protein